MSKRANRRASGPVLQSVFMAVLDCSTLALSGFPRCDPFVIISKHIFAFLALWSRVKHTMGSSILTKIHKHTHLPSLQHPLIFQLLLSRRSRPASHLLSFLSIFVHFCPFLALWSRSKHTRGSSILTNIHRHTHLPNLQHPPNLKPLLSRRSRAASHSLSFLSRRS